MPDSRTHGQFRLHGDDGYAIIVRHAGRAGLQVRSHQSEDEMARSAGQPASRSANPSDNAVQRTRAWTGLWVVVGGDVAIALAAVLGIWKTSGSASSSPMVAILTSAFTAIGTMTTAYFGIKTMSNTAQSFAPAVHSAVTGAQGTSNAGNGDGGSSPSGAPIPADPSNPTAAEIVARMAEPTS
jgi:hypothetical protein